MENSKAVELWAAHRRIFRMLELSEQLGWHEAAAHFARLLSESLIAINTALMLASIRRYEATGDEKSFLDFMDAEIKADTPSDAIPGALESAIAWLEEKQTGALQ